MLPSHSHHTNTLRGKQTAHDIVYLWVHRFKYATCKWLHGTFLAWQHNILQAFHHVVMASETFQTFRVPGVVHNYSRKKGL
jgi:hypothetical protein